MSIVNGKELSKTALAKKLTKKQKDFAHAYVQTGSLAEAARRAGHPDKSARKVGWQYMNDGRYINVKAYVEMLEEGVADIKKLSPEHIAVGMLKEATQGDVAGARVRAWELLGKWRGMLVDRIEDVSQQPVINLLKTLRKVDREMAEQLAPMFGYNIIDLVEEENVSEGLGEGSKEEAVKGTSEGENGKGQPSSESDKDEELTKDT